VSGGQIAALIAAGAFVVLVLLLAIPLIKLGRTLDEATIAIRKAHENSDPLFRETNTTLNHVNTQLERVDGITSNAQAVTGNVSALTSVFTATLGGPLVKVAAFSYGVNKALKARRKVKAAAGEGKHSRRARRRARKEAQG
jgi:predicted PurR-regulated permease PerM